MTRILARMEIPDKPTEEERQIRAEAIQKENEKRRRMLEMEAVLWHEKFMEEVAEEIHKQIIVENRTEAIIKVSRTCFPEKVIQALEDKNYFVEEAKMIFGGYTQKVFRVYLEEPESWKQGGDSYCDPSEDSIEDKLTTEPMLPKWLRKLFGWTK